MYNMSPEMKKQFSFVEFLKRHRIYNEFENALTMQKMQEVWEHATVDTERRLPRKLKDGLNVHCYHCKEEGYYDPIISQSEVREPDMRIVTTGNGTNIGYNSHYVCSKCYKEKY